MKTIIFANGEIKDIQLLVGLVHESDFIIAADGGLNHIRKLKLVPDLLVGDLDQWMKRPEWLEKKGVEIRKFSTHKDQTDLELAILEAVDLAHRG